MGERVTLKVGDKMLLKEASFHFPLGKTIVITGSNGSGKTTFLHHILSRGEGMVISPKAFIGAYEQMVYHFEKDETVLEYMKERSDYNESKIRSVLHSMNFTGNDLNKNSHHLSGGEAIRLVLCQRFLGRYNVLILDQPTNFLDVFCIEELERFIKAYEGTIVLVSHDCMFFERVVDCVYAIEQQQLIIRKNLVEE